MLRQIITRQLIDERAGKKDLTLFIWRWNFLKIAILVIRTPIINVYEMLTLGNRRWVAMKRKWSFLSTN